METTGHHRSQDTAIIFAGGDPTDIAATSLVGIGSMVIAADSGLEEAERVGLQPDLVVGDLDSVNPASLQRALDAGVEVERHPPDKDSTDLELALDAAIGRGYMRLVVVGGRGGRLSHLLGNATLLALPRYQLVEIEWRAGSSTVFVTDARRPCNIVGSPGDLVSLVPLNAVQGIVTEGLVWTLEAGALSLGTTRGISNELSGTEASVRVESGTLLVVVEKGER